MPAIQTASNSSEELTARVELASKRHRDLFKWNVVWLVFAGLFTVWLSWRVWKAGNAEQSAMADAASERISVVERQEADAKAELSKALTKQATTELALERLRAAQGPRKLNGEAFRKALEGKPKAKTELWYEPDNGEAFLLALNICGLLRESDWEVADPIPIPPNQAERLPVGRATSFFNASTGLFSGVAVRHSGTSLPELSEDKRRRHPAQVLFKALIAGGISDMGAIGQAELPTDTIRVIVGAKP